MKPIFFFILTLFTCTLFGQSPNRFNYQAVARDAGGQVITGTIAIRLSIMEDANDGILRYTETHQVNTDPQGVFSLHLGNGVIESGDFDAINWNNHTYWLKVEMKTASASDFTEMGRSQFLTVPYAMYAASSGDALTAGQGLSIDNHVIQNTGDLSNSNELQSLTVNGNQLSISNGNSVTMPTGTTYNEGAGIDIVNNTIIANDISPTNEMQTLTVNGNQLSISGGNNVTLPTGTTYTAGAGINISANVISAIDANTTNEIQTLSLNGQQLSLSNGGGSVNLPTGGANGWTINGNITTSSPNTNNVQIGAVSDAARLNVASAGNLDAGSFFSPGTGNAINAYNNGAGTAVRGISATGFGGYFSSGEVGLCVPEGDVLIGSTTPQYGAKFEVDGGGVFNSQTQPNLPALHLNATGSSSGLSSYAYGNATAAYLYVVQQGRTLYLSGPPGIDHGIEVYAGGDSWQHYIDSSHDWNFAYNDALKAYIRDTDGSYQNTSDRRLKKNIQPISDVLTDLGTLQAYTYQMKDAADDSPISVGFMAQDVEARFPELVTEKDGFKTICYDHFAVLGIQAVNEQQKEIDELHALIKAMQTTIDHMQAELAKPR